ncbi:SusC/RagA family TonB-linked outer membrane protein [Salinimicrobium sp. GXAS 041]|uniref:SusC/RagA family TonB-linked outer membrane protein n=1 Tax=Salinimicrobium sp. GXAS 041 TaxID=3400806 RepID=UPI003C76FC9A
MRKKLQMFFLFFLFLFSAQTFAQERAITGKVFDAQGMPVPQATVRVPNTAIGTTTNFDGEFRLVVPQLYNILTVSYVGFKEQEIVLDDQTYFEISLTTDVENLDEVVVTALGITQEKKALAYTVTEIEGVTIAETQRENFLDAMAGRVAGVDIQTTSGLPGSSTSIVIRGISSLSGNNQPLFVVDGLPISNNTTSTAVFASSIGAGGTSFENRGVDFTNRAADINPQDIESITILKGPEASALYGIEAASGAVVITTKRGKAGDMRVDYSNSFRVDRIVEYPEIQQVYGRGSNGYTLEGDESLYYFGERYPEGTEFYDNVGNFFQETITKKHNLSFSGGTEAVQYRLSAGHTDSEGFVPTTGLERLNLSSSITANVNDWIRADVTFDYTRSDNDQTFRGAGGPLLHLLLWPSTDDASNYLTPGGQRRNYADFATAVENPFFNVNSNIFNSLTDRYKMNTRLDASPSDWLRFVGQVGVDYYTQKSTIVRHPESNTGRDYNGIFDQALVTTRNLTMQSYAQFTPPALFSEKFSTDIKVGGAIYDYNTFSAAAGGQDFQAPDLWSINNTRLDTHRAFNNLTQRRLVGLFASANFNYDDMLYMMFTARNDWSSTLPVKNNSFFYPSAGLSFIFTELDAFEGISDVLSFGKLRASVAQVGKDARPYSIRPFYENAQTTGGGFRYGFTGPSLNLKPEITTSYEYGMELKLFNGALGLDATYFNKRSEDQIVQNLRLSYATGFVLMTFNAGEIQNEGVELQLKATPIQNQDFSWDILANFTKNWSELVSLPGDVAEFYNSDTWLYGNVRVGSRVGGPLTTFTGYDFEKNEEGEILVNPSNGLPILDTSEWVVVGDRNPDFNIGLSNSFRYKNWSMNFLLDFRVGGDVYNATEHYLTTRGLSPRTLDREVPRIVDGVLRDGLENSADPTENNIPIDLARNSSYWSSIYPYQSFIEKDVNWMRLRDVTLNYYVPRTVLNKTNAIESASVFVTGTDLFLLTNYSGLDPVGSGNSAAVGGAGGTGLDYGNFPMPIGINFGVRIGL